MPQERLDVNSGETYTVDSGDSEEYYGADVDGTLQINGTLSLIDNPSADEQEQPDIGPGTAPISLPLEIDLRNMNMGTAIFLTGFMALLGGMAAFLRNYAAGIVWALALFTLVVSGLLQLGLEIYWTMVAATCLLLIVGMVVRWTR
jgi:hypothetical protein